MAEPAIAAPTTPAAAPAPSAPAAPAAPVGAPAAPAPVAEPSNAPFYSSIADTDLKTWVEGKGWKGVDAMAESARNLEKMIGAPADEVFRLPKNADPATLDTLYSRLGRPASADKYDLPVPDGVPVDTGFQAAIKPVMHKIGLTAEQAKVLSQAQGEYVKAAMEQQAKDYDLGVAADEQALQAEWRGGYDRQINLASTAVKQLGFTGEAIDGIEAAIGYKETMKLFAGLAAKLGEDNFVIGQNKGGFLGTATPAEAKAEWERLANDKAFGDALMNKQNIGHAAAIEKKSALMRLMAGQS